MLWQLDKEEQRAAHKEKEKEKEEKAEDRYIGITFFSLACLSP